MARVLSRKPRLVIASLPTQGLDIGAIEFDSGSQLTCVDGDEDGFGANPNNQCSDTRIDCDDLDVDVKSRFGRGCYSNVNIGSVIANGEVDTGSVEGAVPETPAFHTARAGRGHAGPLSPGGGRLGPRGRRVHNT